MEVTDTSTLARVLDSMNLEYKIISATTADVFAKVNVTQLTLALAKENCQVRSMRKLFWAAIYRTESRKLIRKEFVIAVLLPTFIILNGYFQTNLTNAYI